MPLPPLTSAGDLPLGVHRSTLKEVVARFGVGTRQRVSVAERLERVYRLAKDTGNLARFIIFGSFVTDKPEPNDLDVFMLMEDTFDGAHLWGEAAILFDHAAAEAHFGASVFWVRRLAAFGGEQATIEYWQAKRDKGKRGIVEVVEETP